MVINCCCRANSDIRRLALLNAIEYRGWSTQKSRKIGCRNVRFRVGDGTFGWSAHAPYDAIMVTAAAAAVPASLESQLGDSGRMILPVGGPGFQELVLVRREGGAFGRQKLLSVRFVPLVSTH